MKGWPALLFPKIRSFRHYLGKQSIGKRLKLIILVALAVGFWLFTFLVFQKVLIYFRSVELFGDLLNYRLLSMMLLTFFSILLFSNLISALSTFFLSEDLNLIMSRPVPLDDIYYARLIETLVYSSWMVLLFALPVFLAYGRVYGASWKYYAVFLGALMPFLLIPSTLGVLLAMVLVNLFPARRTKDILFLLTLFLVIGIYFLLRFLQPERLVNPDSFASLVDYITALSAPSWPFSPSFWFAESMVPFLQPAPTQAGFYLACLWSTATALVVIGSWVPGPCSFPGGRNPRKPAGSIWFAFLSSTGCAGTLPVTSPLATSPGNKGLEDLFPGYLPMVPAHPSHGLGSGLSLQFQCPSP